MAGPELLGPGRPRHGRDRRADAKVADTDRKVNGAPCQVNGRLLEAKLPPPRKAVQGRETFSADGFWSGFVDVFSSW